MRKLTKCTITGFVGKIKLQIPVSRLRSEPWVIFIERLFLIAGPILSSEVQRILDLYPI